MNPVCTAAAFARAWNHEKDQPKYIRLSNLVESAAALTLAKTGPDHTHVATSSGRVYSCEYDGYEATGVCMICEGTSETHRTDVLANEDGRAGVRPYYNGVSHQMANRILSLSDGMPIVSKAKKYQFSRILYGTMGVDEDGEQYDLDTNTWREYSLALEALATI